jgi:acyl-[acyl-carrier-protein]-phospholipid O-acyltransferase / long-chain-fatty-acid--[acyl-carrier-protein] ligase
MTTEFRQLLPARKFLPLLLSQFLGAFNDNFFKNALVVMITYKLIRTGNFSTDIMVTIASGLFVLPFFLFSALAGELADKFEKASLIKIIKFFEILIAILAAYGFIVGNIITLMLALFLLAVQFAMFGPVKYSFLPERLALDELIAGNGLIDASTFIAILLGTILGSLAISRSSYISIFISGVLILVACLGWGAALFLPKKYPTSSVIKIDANIFRSTARIIREAFSNSRKVTLAILGASWFWLLGFALISQFPTFVAEIMHGSGKIMTLFLALFTIGVAVGSLLCNLIMKDKISNTSIPASAFGMSIFLFDFILTAAHKFPDYATSNYFLTLPAFLSSFSGWHMVIDLFLFAVCGGIYIVPIYVILQAVPSKNLVSRIVAGNNIVNAIFMVAGTALIWLFQVLHFSLLSVFAIFAALNFLVAIYICKLIPDAVTKSLVKWLLQLLFRVKVTGIENVKPDEGPYLIVANHNSFLDAALIAAFYPERLVFAINKEIAQNFWIRKIFGLVRLYPIDPTNPMATKGLIKEVKAGNNVMIFPEGRITKTGALMKIYPGPGVIALRAHAKVLPIRIDGAQYSLFSYLKHRVKRRLFPKISLKILPARELVVDPNLKGRVRRDAIATQLYDLMTLLMFASTDCEQTIFSKLLDASKIHDAKKIIVIDAERKTLSYKKIIQYSFLFARVLGRISERSNNVGILLPNSTSLVALFSGCQAANRVPVMLNYTAGAANLELALKTAEIKVVFTSRRFVEYVNFQAIISKLALQAKIIYLEDLAATISVYEKIAVYIWAKAPGFVYRRILKPAKPEDPAVILFTSGSEGAPKGVVLSHKNLLINCAQLAAKIDFHGQDLVFNALPNFHSFGLTGGILLPLLHGIKSFYFPNPLKDRVVPELVYDTYATIIFGTDTFLAGYAKAAHPYDFYSLRYVFAGAEKVREETRKIWNEKFGIRILEGYGATEASPIISTNTPMHNQYGSVGRFLPGINYKLEDVPGIEIGKQLFVQGGNIALGYYKVDQPGVLQAFSDSWYNTGDIVTIDRDGYIKIIGRAKRFAKIAGEMISLSQVETICASAWPNDVHAVINVPDQKKGEKLVLVTTNKNITKSVLHEVFVASGSSDLMQPKEIMYIEKLPLLGSGKVDYVALTASLNVR